MVSEHLKQYAAQKYRSRKAFYVPIQKELDEGFAKCTEEEAVLMQFLYGTMPVRDAGEYSFDTFLSYVKHSLWLRENMSWCKELEEDIFIHHVLYYRINSEDINDCRAFFYEQLKDRIKGLSELEAVKEINYWCAEHAVYQASDGRTASAMTTYRSGKGRCGEESTFTVTAYRSVGIPARQVYAPRWAHCDDNHAWVEVYMNGKWYFLGACEPEEVLNSGWFTTPASRAILIHTRVFSDFVSQQREDCLGQEEDLLTYFNNTDFYAKTRTLTIKVTDKQGQVVEGAEVAIEVLNMAEYSVCAYRKTDEKGEAYIVVGMGDIHIRAFSGKWFGETFVSVDKTGFVEVAMDCFAEDTSWITDEWRKDLIHAPEPSRIHPGTMTEEQKETTTRRNEQAQTLREQRFEDCYDAERAAACKEEEMLRIAGENFDEVYCFLTADENPNRRKMLHSLAKKDYKDLKASILEDHLTHYRNLMPELDEKEETDFVLRPRIFIEELTPYRSFIQNFFTEKQQKEFVENPKLIWKYIEENINYDFELDYKTIFATPIGCLKMKQGNPLSQRILFVAICRSLGIPARLNRVAFKPEYYTKDGFVCPFEEECVKNHDSAVLTLKVEDGNQWHYAQTWTIGEFKENAFYTLHYYGKKFENNEMTLHLEPGIYRILTTVRKPNGDQQVCQRCFTLKDKEEKCIEMMLWEHNIEELLVNKELSGWMEDVEFTLENESTVKLSEAVGEDSVLLAFLGVGAEPTEHVLNEFLDIKDSWNQAGLKTFFILREKKELANATLQKTLKAIQNIQVCYADKNVAVQAADQMQEDNEKRPVLIVVKNGHTGIYSCSGYNVGNVDVIRKIMEKL